MDEGGATSGKWFLVEQVRGCACVKQNNADIYE